MATRAGRMGRGRRAGWGWAVPQALRNLPLARGRGAHEMVSELPPAAARPCPRSSAACFFWGIACGDAYRHCPDGEVRHSGYRHAWPRVSARRPGRCHRRLRCRPTGIAPGAGAKVTPHSGHSDPRRLRVAPPTAGLQNWPSMVLHFLIRGRVQGVGFRWFVHREASELDLRGWVRNTEDGEVEVVASASVADLAALRSSLRRGPRGARVDQLIE